MNKEQCYYYHNQKDVWAIPSGFTKEMLQNVIEPKEYCFLESTPVSNGTALYYIMTNYITSIGQHPTISIAIRLNMNTILEQMKIQDTYTAIYTKGEPIFTTGWKSEEEFPKGVQEYLESEQREFIYQNALFFSQTSSNIQTLYVVAVSLKDFYVVPHMIRTVCFIYLLFCIVLTVLLSLFFSKRHYNPVKEILLLIGKMRRSPIENQNEFQIIQMTLFKLFEQENRYVQRISKQNQALKNGILSQLVKGRRGASHDLLEEIQSFGVQLDGMWYALAALCIEEEAGYFFEQEITEDGELLDLLYFAVSNIAEELYGQEFCCFVGEVEGNIVVLVNTGQETVERNKRLRDVSESICRILKSDFGATVTCNLSEFHLGEESLLLCYSELSELFEYRNWTGQEANVLEYSTVSNTIKRSKSEEALSEEVIRDIHFHEYEKAKKLLEKLCEQTDKRKEWSLGEHLDEVDSYIMAHFQDPNLSVTEIADSLQVSQSYLSQTYKKQKGVGVLESIHYQRIHLAEQFLLEGMSLKQLAEKCGYFNLRTFIRAFKRIEGVTPSEYREREKQKKQGNLL